MALVDRLEKVLDALMPVVKWALPFMTLFAALGLVFNTLLAGRLGFDPPATFDLADHIPSGMFMILDALWQIIAIAVSGILVMLILTGLSFLIFFVGRFSLRLKHNSYFNSARLLNRKEREADQAPEAQITEQQRAYLRSESNRRYRTARQLREGRAWLKKDQAFWPFVSATVSDFMRVLSGKVKPRVAKATSYVGARSLVATWIVVIVTVLSAFLIGPARVEAYVALVADHTRIALIQADLGDQAEGDDTSQGGAVPETRKGSTAETQPGSIEAVFEAVSDGAESIHDSFVLASQKPQLVSLKLKSTAGYLRPMVRIVTYGKYIILYDFITRESEQTKGIYPLRVVQREDIAGWVSAGALKPGQGRFALHELIRAICLEPKESAEDGKLSWEDVRNDYLDGDYISCATADEPTVHDAGDDETDRLLGDILTSLENISGTVADLAANEQALGRTLGDSLAILTTTMGEVVLRLSDPEPPSTNIVVNVPDRTHPQSPVNGRWDHCTEELSSWSREAGIQFRNGRWLLEGPDNNHLVPNPTTAGSWQLFESLLELWTEQIILAQEWADYPGRPYLVLIGRASENGDVLFNARLTERRAMSVKKALLSAARPLNWEETGLTAAQIIAVGEGETVLVPTEDVSAGSARRVDARLCFVEAGEAVAQETASVTE